MPMDGNCERDSDAYATSGAPLAARTGSDAVSENRELRIMLAVAHAGLALYTDDGELQDNRMSPFIDFKRDSVNEIERKLHARLYTRKQQNGELSDRASKT